MGWDPNRVYGTGSRGGRKWLLEEVTGMVFGVLVFGIGGTVAGLALADVGGLGMPRWGAAGVGLWVAAVGVWYCTLFGPWRRRQPRHSETGRSGR